MKPTSHLTVIILVFILIGFLSVSCGPNPSLFTPTSETMDQEEYNSSTPPDPTQTSIPTSKPPSPTPFPICEPSAERTCAVLMSISDGFEFSEYYYAHQYLGQAGYKVVIAGPSLDQIVGGDGTTTIQPGIIFTDANPEKYDAVIFVGRIDYMLIHNNSSQVNAIIHEFYNQNSLLAAICGGVEVLSASGILEGKKATTVDPLAFCASLENNGAICIDERTVRDGNIITAQGPETSKDFGLAILIALSE